MQIIFNILLWHFFSYTTKLKKIIEWNPIYTPFRFYHYHFTMLYLSHIYATIHFSAYSLIHFEFQSYFQTSEKFSLNTSARIWYISIFASILYNLHAMKYKKLSVHSLSFDKYVHLLTYSSQDTEHWATDYFEEKNKYLG